MKSLRKSVLLVAAVLAMGAQTGGAAVPAKSAPTFRIQADKIVLLDFVRVGNSLIAVGERGVVMRSSDEGRHWEGHQAPTTRALTSLTFLNDKVGVAVGHGGTLMRTEDGGATWHPVEFKDIGRDAVLGVTALKSGTVLAYGAFGMFLVSDDQGKTWRRETAVAEDFDRHISKIIETHDGTLMLVAETGVISRSKDQGKTWEQLKSPYEGSFFGILEMKDGALLAYGMRGNIYRSTDEGNTWEQVPFDSKITLNGGSVAPDGRVVLAGNRGLLAVSEDAGKTFKLYTAPEGTSLSQARIVDGALVYTGVAATGRLPLAPAATGASPAIGK